MRLKVCFQEEQNFKVDLSQNDIELQSDFGEIETIVENNYNNLTNKPSINGVELVGNKTGEDLDLGSAVFPSGGSAGDVLGIDDNDQIAWITLDSGTIDYEALINKPQINGITLGGDQSAADLGLGTYTLPSGGIPASDLSAAVQASLSAADSAYVLPSDGIPKSDLSDSVQSSLNLADNAIQKPAQATSGQELVFINNTWVAADKVFIINMYPQDETYSGTMDKTIAEIYEAYLDGKHLWYHLWTDIDKYVEAECTMRWEAGEDYDYPSFNAFIIDDGNNLLFEAATGATSDGTRNNYFIISYPLGYPTPEQIGAYVKPSDGIPSSDLSAAVQSSLSLANSALQSSSVDSALSSNSTNPVQNKVITSALNDISVTGLPSGGTQGQLLMKSSNTDYITEWISPANSVEQDNTRPITAAAVYTEVGNIQALLAII